jgi:hypothetical protein
MIKSGHLQRISGSKLRMNWQPFIDLLHGEMASGIVGRTGQHIRLQFDGEGCNREQRELLQQLKASKILETATWLGRVERE